MKQLRLTGRQFHHWKVIGKASPPPGKFGTWWECRCRCGTRRDIRGTSLISGKSRSCGCNKLALSAAEKARRYDTAVLRRLWTDMLGRCYEQLHPSWVHYGAAGATVCGEWKSDFHQFRADMGERPYPGASIERIDSGKPFGPGNCRWSARGKPAEKPKLTIPGLTQKQLAACRRDDANPRKVLALLNQGVPEWNAIVENSGTGFLAAFLPQRDD